MLWQPELTKKGGELNLRLNICMRPIVNEFMRESKKETLDVEMEKLPWELKLNMGEC